MRDNNNLCNIIAKIKIVNSWWIAIVRGGGGTSYVHID